MNSLELNEVEFINHMERRFNDAVSQFTSAEMTRLTDLANVRLVWAAHQMISPEPVMFKRFIDEARANMGYGLTMVEMIAENESLCDHTNCDHYDKGLSSVETFVKATKLNDTGLRTKISTGALRERAPGKGRFDAVSPIALERLALHMELADIKYKEGGGCRNWEKGMPLSYFEDGARRHLNQWRMGDTSEDHMSAVLWNIMCLIHTDELIRIGELPKELADIPFYNIKPKTVKTSVTHV